MSSKPRHSVSVTGTGDSAIHSFTVGNEFPCGLQVVVSGTVNYTVKYTMDNTNWLAHDYLAGLTSTDASHIFAPVAAVKVTNNSGTGTSTLTIVEAQ